MSSKETPEEKLAQRRRIVAYLRHMAVRQEELAAEFRRQADRLDPDIQARQLPELSGRDDDYTPEAIDRTTGIVRDP